MKYCYGPSMQKRLIHSPHWRLELHMGPPYMCPDIAWSHIQFCPTVKGQAVYVSRRPFSVYSIGDGSRQRFLCFVKGKKMEKKKLQGSDFFFLVGDILRILVVFGQTTDLGINFSLFSACRREKKLKRQLFFSRQGQCHLIGGLVAHRIYWEWPYESTTW